MTGDEKRRGREGKGRGGEEEREREKLEETQTGHLYPV